MFCNRLSKESVSQQRNFGEFQIFVKNIFFFSEDLENFSDDCENELQIQEVRNLFRFMRLFSISK